MVVIVFNRCLLCNFCFFIIEKERRQRKLRGNEMRRKYRERSLPNATEDAIESMYNLLIY